MKYDNRQTEKSNLCCSDRHVTPKKEDIYSNMKTRKVTAAIIINDNKVFAAQRGHGAWKGWWEFPGGKLEPGETSVEALIREIREELAIDIEIDRLFQTVEYDYSDFHLSMDCFICKLCGSEPVLLEHESARWLSADELESVNWLPSDIELIKQLKNII